MTSTTPLPSDVAFPSPIRLASAFARQFLATTIPKIVRGVRRPRGRWIGGGFSVNGVRHTRCSIQSLLSAVLGVPWAVGLGRARSSGIAIYSSAAPYMDINQQTFDLFVLILVNVGELFFFPAGFGSKHPTPRIAPDTEQDPSPLARGPRPNDGTCGRDIDVEVWLLSVIITALSLNSLRGSRRLAFGVPNPGGCRVLRRCSGPILEQGITAPWGDGVNSRAIYVYLHSGSNAGHVFQS